MRAFASILLLVSAAVLLGTGCVNRTVSAAAGRPPNDPEGTQAYGYQPHSKVVEKKTIWFWQKEFYQGK